MSRWLKRVLYVVAGIVVVLAVLGTLLVRHWGHVHQHCIKVAGFAFREYADSHEGKLPYHANGFGDALLLLVKEKDLPDVSCICGPDDDGSLMNNALTNNSHLPEEACSRVYVQGLTKDDSGICILFDRHSVKGGDHSYGYGPKLREVCMADGSMNSIKDDAWPAFASKQIELLVTAGIKESEARRLYALADK